MAVRQSQRTAADKWDREHMCYQTVKVRKTLLDDFKAACAARGDRVNTVLRRAMEQYVSESSVDICGLTLNDLTKIRAILSSLVTGDDRSGRMIREVREKVNRVWNEAVERERRATGP